jgi:hypothetical protein
MRYRVVVPAETTDAIPHGAALLESHGRPSRDSRRYGVVFAGREQFGELCAQAARQGRRVVIPEDCTEVGYYDAIDGELRAQSRRRGA